jgi:hypothetical protein
MIDTIDIFSLWKKKNPQQINKKDVGRFHWQEMKKKIIFSLIISIKWERKRRNENVYEMIKKMESHKALDLTKKKKTAIK